MNGLIANRQQLQEMLDKAADVPPNKFHGMTYIEGVEAALNWALDPDSDSPIE